MLNIKSNPRVVIAVYPGRFQPMGLHHKMTYDWMVSTFGLDNSFITTSGKTIPGRSPLVYSEKLAVSQAHGIPEDKFVLCRSPYQPVELFESLSSDRGLYLADVSIVFVVGQKDMSESPRFRVGYKKSGEPTYYQHYNPGANLESADRHGYLVVAPHVDYSLPNGKESSGTNLREFLAIAEPGDFEKAMGFYDLQLDKLFKMKFGKALMEERVRDDLVLGTKEYEDYIENLIDDIMHVKKSLRSRKNRNARKEASRLQSAVDSLRYLNRKNARQLHANSLKETKSNKEEKLTRDEIKCYFSRLKR